MHAFSKSDERRFWENYAGSYQGAKNAELLIFLSKPYIGARVLDAGAGDGSLVRALLAHANVTGVDMAPKGVGVDQGDLTKLPYSDGAFDTVFCVEVIEHLSPQDTSKVLGELRRVLAPSGVLIVTTPYAEDLEENLVTFPRCDISFHRWGHQQNFREADFRKLAGVHGLEPVVIVPIKYSRVRRLRFLGQRFFMSAWWKRKIAQAKGKLHLLMIARRR